jgi:phosphoglycolate phosphatase-like HAD superfamily hydrolase
MDQPRLVLWDVDHTLVTTGGVGNEIYREAFQRATGVTVRELADMTGRTEPVIYMETLALHDLSPSDNPFTDFARVQADLYRQRADELRRRGSALPGVPLALDRLRKTANVYQTVLTGNTRPAAEAKLSIFGIADAINFDVGAYGTDSDTRPPLVGIARHRAEDTYGLAFGRDDSVIIGDTVNDVRAGQSGGARVIAVATGSTSIDDLAEAGAETVLPDLTDTDRLLAAILRA